MSKLEQFLSTADIGVRRHGDAVHITMALAETLVTAAGFITFGAGTVATAVVTTVATPILGMAGVFMALGSGYEKAREEIKNEAVVSGFSRGFICGLLNMSAATTKSLFGQHGLGQRNPMDPESDVLEMAAYNKGLVAGYGMASRASEEDKKAFLFEIKPHTGNLGGGAWGDREKVDYVVTYAAKLRLHFIGQ